jgi:hypothetical protein
VNNLSKFRGRKDRLTQVGDQGEKGMIDLATPPIDERCSDLQFALRNLNINPQPSKSPGLF